MMILFAATNAWAAKDCAVPVTTSRNCLFCDMFRVLFNAGSLVAGLAYETFHTAIGEIVVVFLAVSLALITLKNLASFGAKDTGAILNELFQKAFIGAVIYIIISREYYNVINLTLVPIFEAGLSFGLHSGNSCPNAYDIRGFTTNASANSANTGGMPVVIGQMIVCAVEQVETKINALFEFSKWGFCLGTGPERILKIIPNPIYLIDSAMLYLAGVFLMVAYPWVMGDAVLQLGIAMAIAPFAVGGFAFSGTRSYLSKVFNWILHSLFVFMFMGILLFLLIDYIGELLQEYIAGGDPKQIFTDINGLAFYGSNMFRLLFVLVIAWAYMPTVTDLAGTFSEGSGLSAVANTGKAVTDQVEKKTRKAADWTANKAENAAGGMLKSAARGTRYMGRIGALGAVRTFGFKNSAGDKTYKMFGRTYTAKKNADGSRFLERQWVNAVNGRTHTMASDAYSTIKIERDANGNVVRRDVNFKQSFLEEHLLNKEGTLNVQAMQALLSSPLAQNPEYKKALMEGIAVKLVKQQGGEVGNYFRTRNVKFDPNDPGKIQIEQVDQTGLRTTFEMNTDLSNGKFAVSYLQENDPNRFDNAAHNAKIGAKTIARNTKIKSMKKIIKTLGVDDGTGRTQKMHTGFATWTAHTDVATGETLYTQEYRKYWLFGKKIKKTYRTDGTEREIFSKKGQQRRDKQNDLRLKMADKVAGGTANADGGFKKNHLWYTYESHIDSATGETYYTRHRRWSFGEKDTVEQRYYQDKTETVVRERDETANKRGAQQNKKRDAIRDKILYSSHLPNATGGHIHEGLFTTYESHVSGTDTYYSKSHRTLSGKTKTTYYYKDKTVTEFKDRNGTILKSEVQKIDTQPKVHSSKTKNVNEFGDSHIVTHKDLDGNIKKTDQRTGETIEQEKFRGKYTGFIYNGKVKANIRGKKTEGDLFKGQARTADEVTTFNYSDEVQAKHDHIISDLDGNQVVEADGTIANDVNDLLDGMDSFAGLDNVNGIPMKDFIKDKMLAEGRRRRTNKLHTNIDWTRDYRNISDGQGNIIGRIDATGNVFIAGGGTATVSGDSVIDASGVVIGHIL